MRIKMLPVAPLEECVVLVTGGANGLGYQMVKNFVQNNAKKVLIVDFNEKLGRDVEKEFGDKVEFIKCDVANNDEVDNLIKYTMEKYNGVQVLLNNAGICDEGNIDRTIAINLTAVITMSLKFYTLPTPPHTIINTASIYGFRSSDGFIPVYQASKYGVVGLVKSLGHSQHYDHTGIRVIALCPGMTKTDLNQVEKKDPLYPGLNYLIPKLEETFDKYIWQEPEEVGKAIIEIYKKAKSGSLWLIEGGKLEEVKQ